MGKTSFFAAVLLVAKLGLALPQPQDPSPSVTYSSTTVVTVQVTSYVPGSTTTWTIKNSSAASSMTVIAAEMPSQTSTATTTSASSTSTSVAGPGDASYTSDATFQSAILSTANTFRHNHNASDLSWNSTLAIYAQNVTTSCDFAHSNASSQGYGENIAATYPNASAAVAAWGDEGAHYNYASPSYKPTTGHFTQLVWKASTQIGCGRQYCGNGDDGKASGWFVVCEFYPAGNVIGSAFSENVDPPTQQSQVQSAGAEGMISEFKGAASSVTTVPKVVAAGAALMAVLLCLV